MQLVQAYACVGSDPDPSRYCWYDYNQNASRWLFNVKCTSMGWICSGLYLLIFDNNLETVSYDFSIA